MEMLLKTKLNSMNSHSLLEMLVVCPALAVTTTVSRSLVMCAAMAFVLILSELIVSLMKKIVPVKLRGLVYLTTAAFSASMAEILVKLVFPMAAKSLGVYLPILAVSCVVLMRVESCAAKSTVGASLVDALTASGKFAIIMLAAAFVRELFGAGTLFAAPDGSGGVAVFKSAPLPILAKTAGVLLLTAVGVALIKYVKYKMNNSFDTESEVL